MKPPSPATAGPGETPGDLGAGTADDTVRAQPDTQVYVPFKGWLDAEPGRHVLAAAALLIALQALIRGYVKLGGWFVADDMSFIGRAEHLPFLSREYLLEGWNGHFMPGSFALVRALNALWPVNYVPVAVVDLLLQATAAVLAYRLLVALFGRRPAILVPLAIYLFSPITLPAFLWWAAALNQLPGQIAMIGALLLQVRYHRTGRTSDGVLGALAVLAGLLFSEKVLLVVPCVFAMTLLFFTAGRPPVRLRRAVVDHWRVWVAYLLVVVPYAVYYVTQIPSPVGRSVSTVVAVQTVGTALTHAVLPALFGGPLRWQQIGVGGVADPNPAFLVATAVVSALIVWFSIVRRQRAVLAWVIVAGYWLANAILLGVTRASYVGPIIGAEYRYSTDVCVIFAVFGAAAFLPLREGTFAKGAPQRLVPRRSSTSAPTGTLPPLDRRALLREILPAEGALAGALCCAVIVPSVVSTMQYDRFWRDNGSPGYFANARRDIANSKRHLTLSEINLPERVQAGFLGAFVKTSTMMSGFTPRPSFLTPGRSSNELFTPDDTGHLRAVFVDGFHNQPGPEKSCGWRVDSSPVLIPLEKATLPWQWTVRMDYLATADASTTVTAGTVTTPVTIHAGANSLYVIGEGAIGSVVVDGLSNGGLCTDDVSVGFARPIPDTHP